jgi:hypothetical protein
MVEGVRIEKVVTFRRASREKRAKQSAVRERRERRRREGFERQVRSGKAIDGGGVAVMIVIEEAKRRGER